MTSAGRTAAPIPWPRDAIWPILTAIVAVALAVAVVPGASAVRSGATTVAFRRSGDRIDRSNGITVTPSSVDFVSTSAASPIDSDTSTRAASTDQSVPAPAPSGVPKHAGAGIDWGATAVFAIALAVIGGACGANRLRVRRVRRNR